MATKTKTKATGAKYPPNSLTRREATRKAGKCQLCEAKVALKDQFTVTNDLEAGVATKKKNAERKGAEKASHYCGECAEKRVTQKEAWMASVGKREKKKATATAGGGKTKVKAVAKTKTGAKAKAKTKAVKGEVERKAAVKVKTSAKDKAAARKAAKAEKSSGEVDPF